MARLGGFLAVLTARARARACARFGRARGVDARLPGPAPVRARPEPRRPRRLDRLAGPGESGQVDGVDHRPLAERRAVYRHLPVDDRREAGGVRAAAERRRATDVHVRVCRLHPARPSVPGGRHGHTPGVARRGPNGGDDPGSAGRRSRRLDRVGRGQSRPWCGLRPLAGPPLPPLGQRFRGAGRRSPRGRERDDVGDVRPARLLRRLDPHRDARAVCGDRAVRWGRAPAAGRRDEDVDRLASRRCRPREHRNQRRRLREHRPVLLRRRTRRAGRRRHRLLGQARTRPPLRRSRSGRGCAPNARCFPAATPGSRPHSKPPGSRRRRSM